MTWRDNLRGASTENGFIIAGGSEMSLVPQNLNWHDYYMNCFTENGVKIANLKEPVEQVSSLPAIGKEGELCYVTGSNPGLYFYDGSSWVSLSTGGGSGPTVVQSIGNSTTSVMSQNAVTTMVFKDPGGGTTVKIGNNADSITSGVAIGYSAKATEENAVAVGCDTIATGVSGATALGFSAEATAGCAAAVGGDAKADASYSVALGYKANTNGKVGAVALGAKSFPTRDGEINVGTTDTNLGYANTNLRVISGVFGGVSASDAATKGQLDAIAIKNAGAPTSSTVGMVGQLLEDTTNAKLYQCTAVDSGIGVDTTAGLTSQISNVTFTISDLSKLNSKISAAATLSAGSYMVRKDAGLAYYISNINDSTRLGSLGNIVPAAFANALGVTPAPANIWSQTAGHLAMGAPVFSFTLVNGGQVTYTWAEVGGGGGSITELTSADYNYPESGTKTSVALWKLPAGLYYADNAASLNTALKVYANDTSEYYYYSTFLVFEDAQSQGYVTIYGLMGSDGNIGHIWKVWKQNGNLSDSLSIPTVEYIQNTFQSAPEVLYVDDYDYPEEDPDGIAVWNLSTNTNYTFYEPVKVYLNSTTSFTCSTNGRLSIGSTSGSNKFFEFVICENGTTDVTAGFGFTNYSTGAKVTLKSYTTSDIAANVSNNNPNTPAPTYPYTSGSRTYYLYNGVEVYVNQMDASQNLYYASDNSLAINGGEWGDNGDGTVSYVGGGSEEPGPEIAPEEPTEEPVEG